MRKGIPNRCLRNWPRSKPSLTLAGFTLFVGAVIRTLTENKGNIRIRAQFNDEIRARRTPDLMDMSSLPQTGLELSACFRKAMPWHLVTLEIWLKHELG